MNKIRVIDLLNKIANGEEVPKNIKVDNDEYIYDILEHFYKREYNGHDLLELSTVYSTNELLNKEAIIIEDEDINIQDINIQDIEELDIIMDYEDINMYSIVDNNRQKINDLIKAVKKLDKEINK